MMKKALLTAGLAAVLATTSMAESQRTYLTTENRFPELGKVEVSYILDNLEFETASWTEHAVQARYGLIENLTLRASVPFVMTENDITGNDNEGLGDASLGLDLLAFEDIFGYPYVIPHADVFLPTGDDDEGLGSGEVEYSFGASIGTVVYDVLRWVLDLSYLRQYDVNPSVDNDVFSTSISLVWDLSEQFSLLTEGSIINPEASDDHTYLLGAGFSYAWSERFDTTFFYGDWSDGAFGEDTSLAVKATYSF